MPMVAGAAALPLPWTGQPRPRQPLTLLLERGKVAGAAGAVVLVAAVGHPPHSQPEGALPYLQIVEDEEEVS